MLQVRSQLVPSSPPRVSEVARSIGVRRGADGVKVGSSRLQRAYVPTGFAVVRDPSPDVKGGRLASGKEPDPLGGVKSASAISARACAEPIGASIDFASQTQRDAGARRHAVSVVVWTCTTLQDDGRRSGRRGERRLGQHLNQNDRGTLPEPDSSPSGYRDLTQPAPRARQPG